MTACLILLLGTPSTSPIFFFLLFLPSLSVRNHETIGSSHSWFIQGRKCHYVAFLFYFCLVFFFRAGFIELSLFCFSLAGFLWFLLGRLFFFFSLLYLNEREIAGERAREV